VWGVVSRQTPHEADSKVCGVVVGGFVWRKLTCDNGGGAQSRKVGHRQSWSAILARNQREIALEREVEGEREFIRIRIFSNVHICQFQFVYILTQMYI